MTEQEALLAQARSDYHVFQLLLEHARSEVPACHPLHYLQMSTEKLAKAAMIAFGQRDERPTHVAFSNLPTVLARNDVGFRLGWRDGRTFRRFLKTARPIFRKIEELSPAVGTSGSAEATRRQPNVEYPWQLTDGAGWMSPVSCPWPVIRELRSGLGLRVLQFVEVLLERFEEVFR